MKKLKFRSNRKIKRLRVECRFSYKEISLYRPIAIQHLIIDVSAKLRSISERARQEANLILSKVLSVKKEFLLNNPRYIVNPWSQYKVRKLVKNYLKGIPLAYLLGQREFWGLDFYVGKGVLIPRPETEHLIEFALSLWPAETKGLRIADLGTGSAAIAISAAKYYHFAQIEAIDISSEAAFWAKKNIAHHELADRVCLKLVHMVEALSGTYDLVLSNPPYIPTDDIKHLALHVQNEPHQALDGGGDGLEFYHVLAKVAKLHLKPSGYCIMEIGAGQSRDIELIMLKEGLSIVKIILDYAGIPRIIVVNKNEGSP